MKKILILIISLLIPGTILNSIVPEFFGARSLSLGYSSSAYNYDINAIYINPAMLSQIFYPFSGYQYQYSYMDYRDFSENLSEILKYDLLNFENIDDSEKKALFSRLKDLFGMKNGLYGFESRIPGFVTRNYGIAYSRVNTAIMNPNGSDIFNKNIEDVSNDDIASLDMNFMGLRYKKLSVAYSLNFARSMNVGISLHYLSGKIIKFDMPITHDVFSSQSDSKDYLEYTWDLAENKFSKLVADLGISMDMGNFFKAALVIKNLGNPTIDKEETGIVLKTRVIAGLAFRPNIKWGIYLDMDLNRTDLLYNGKKIQPFSFGVERGFFGNKFFLRAGFLNDLTEKYFLGKKSNILYCLGLGFNMDNVFVDLAIGIDNNGTIDNLAISGFYLLK